MRLATLLAALLAAPAPAPAQPTIDGAFSAAEGYVLLDDNAGGPSSSFGAQAITSLWATVDDASGSLYLGVGGDVLAGNRILVFLDTRAGGYASGDFGRTGAPQGVDEFDSGTTFDVGFLADYALVIGTNGDQSNYFVDLFTLAGTVGGGGGSNAFVGDVSNADVAASADETSTTQGFEIRLSYSADGIGADLALDRTSILAFGMLLNDGGPSGSFLSNQFVSPASPGSGNYGDGPITFEAAAPDPVAYVFQTMDGRSGWRDLAWPVRSENGGPETVAVLAAQNHVQGTTESFPEGAPNVYLAYLSDVFGGDDPGTPGDERYEWADSNGDPLTSGLGVFWYLYETYPIPVVPEGSNFQPFPFVLQAGGIEPQSDVSYEPATETDNGWYRIGNPYALPYDLAQLTVDDNGGLGPFFDNQLYVWNPNFGTDGRFEELDRTSGDPAARRLAPMQGAFARASDGGAPTFAFAQAGRTTAATPFYGRRADGRIALAFELDRIAGGVAVTEDVTARVRFADGNALGRDADDAPELTPLGRRFAQLAIRADIDGTPEYRAHEGRPAALDGAAAFPLALRIHNLPASDYVLRWPALDNLPADWSVTVEDLVTGQSADLRTAMSLAFRASEGDWADRFVLRVAAAGTAAEEAPAVALDARVVGANPACGVARFRLDGAGRVEAAVFDALGRRVLGVPEGPAGGRVLEIDVTALPAGVYVLRATGTAGTATAPFTVVR